MAPIFTWGTSTSVLVLEYPGTELVNLEVIRKSFSNRFVHLSVGGLLIS